MTITIVLKNGHVFDVKCEGWEMERNRTTNALSFFRFKGVEENSSIYIDVDEVVAIYRRLSDEVLEDGEA